MIGTSAFAASRAGGPLYDARLSLEALTLPSDPTPASRPSSRAPRPGSPRSPRLRRAGDDGAVNAAVRAYATTLADLDAETGTSAGRARDAVLLHQAVLRDLLLRVPTQAQAGIERAISNSTVAIDHLDLASHAPGAPAGAGAGDPNTGRRSQRGRRQRGRRQRRAAAAATRGGGNATAAAATRAAGAAVARAPAAAMPAAGAAAAMRAAGLTARRKRRQARPNAQGRPRQGAQARGGAERLSSNRATAFAPTSNAGTADTTDHPRLPSCDDG